MSLPTASLLVEWNLKKVGRGFLLECDDIAYKFASQLNQKAQSWKTQTPGYVRSTEKMASWILDSTGTRCNEISDSFICLTKLKHHFHFTPVFCISFLPQPLFFPFLVRSPSRNGNERVTLKISSWSNLNPQFHGVLQIGVQNMFNTWPSKSNI